MSFTEGGAKLFLYLDEKVLLQFYLSQASRSFTQIQVSRETGMISVCIRTVTIATLCLHFVITFTAAYNLTILHTNDVHARFEETHTFGGTCSDSHRETDSCVGGVARRATAIQRIRAERGNATLLLDGGDQFQGSFWFYVYQGQATAYFMKRLSYDAMVRRKCSVFL